MALRGRKLFGAFEKHAAEVKRAITERESQGTGSSDGKTCILQARIRNISRVFYVKMYLCDLFLILIFHFREEIPVYINVEVRQITDE